MHFEVESGPSTVSVTRNLKFSLTKLWIACIVVKEKENLIRSQKDNVNNRICNSVTQTYTVLLDLSELGSRTTGKISSSVPEVT